jgi:hypothetical protein
VFAVWFSPSSCPGVSDRSRHRRGRVAVRAAFQPVVSAAASEEVVSEAAVGEVASVRTAHDVVAGAGADEVGAVPGVHAVAPGERANLVTAVGAPEDVVTGRAVDRGGSGDCGQREHGRGSDREDQCRASHLVSFVE